MQPLVESGREHALGGDDVERLEPGDARQQIEVGLEQPLGVGDPVRDGDDDVTDGSAGGTGDELLAQGVLVAAARLAHPALVVAKRAGEKAGLDPHALGRPIEFVGPERLVDQLLEPVHLLRLAPELIVEAQHLGDQPGPQLERQLVAVRGGGARRRLGHDVALDRAQPARRLREPGVQAVVHLVAGHDVSVDGPREQACRAARRHDDQRSFDVRVARCRVRSCFAVL